MSGAREEGSLSAAEQADLIDLAAFPSPREAHQAGTVILAMGEWYVVLPRENDWVLCVRSGIAAEASILVERQRREKPRSTPVAEGPTGKDEFPVPWFGGVMYIVILSAFFLFGSPWVEAGRFDVMRIREQGEWWRLVTPLLFHADAGHLWGNIAGGLFFGYFLAQRVGVWPTWVLAVLTGALGNGFNLLTYWSQGHLSIGASTAVFGLLGTLLGLRLYELWLNDHQRVLSALEKRLNRWRRTGVLVAGLVLLGWMGAGGERTDVLAHLYGFVAGLMVVGISGWWLVARKPTESSPPNQTPEHFPRGRT